MSTSGTLGDVTGQATPPTSIRIVAALAWYDETPAFLHRAITSLAGTADAVAALEGPWAGYPPARHHGNLNDQLDAVRDAAHQAHLTLRVEAGLHWSSQVAKRDYLMRRAGETADWLLVIDADEWLQPNLEAADQTRAILTHTTRDVATVELHHHGQGQRATSAPIRRVYRTPVTVETAHNGYRTPDGRWLHGAPDAVQLEPTVTTTLNLNHEPGARGDPRNHAAAEYRAHRRRHQTERWTT